LLFRNRSDDRKSTILEQLKWQGSKKPEDQQKSPGGSGPFDRFAVFGGWSSEADQRGDAGLSTTTCISPVLTGGTGCAADDR
jgi:hypothetical protein